MLIDEHDRTVTFGEFAAWAERVAAGLVGLGVTADTPVAWQLPTRIESIVLSFALARLGTTAAADHPDLPGPRGRLRCGPGRRPSSSRARHLAQLRLRGDGEGPAGQHRRAVRDPRQVTDTLPEGDPPRCRRPPADGDAVRWLYSTSGTTAAPKCVMHSDQAADRGWAGTHARHAAAARRRRARSPSRTPTSAVPTTWS